MSVKKVILRDEVEYVENSRNEATNFLNKRPSIPTSIIDDSHRDPKIKFARLEMKKWDGK